MTPAQRAIGLAAFVVTVALGLYAVAATLDRWPELVIAAWGAALGAGMAINGIALREMDGAPGGSGVPPAGGRGAALRHQLCSILVATAAWQTAEREHLAWALATIGVGFAWAWTLPGLVAAMERARPGACLHAYYGAFRFMAIAAAVGLVYASVALETAWLWKPSTPADLQFAVWLTILEFAGLPLTLVALAND